MKDEIEYKEYKYTNVFKQEGKIIVRSMSYFSFFNNIRSIVSESISAYEKENKEYIGINPIIVFQGLSWDNIVHLFKLHNIDINGGSITRRHKLSICEYRLSKFLDLFVYVDKEEFYYSYTNKYLNNPKYEYNKEINMTNHPYVSQYIALNKHFSLNIKKNEIETKISSIEAKIEKIKSEVLSLESTKISNEESISNMKAKISELKQKIVTGISTKHKATLTGRIKKIKDEILNIKNEKTDNSSEVSRLTRDLNKNLKLLHASKTEYNEIKNELVNIKSNIKVFYPEKKINGVDHSTISNRREYHSLSSSRYISTNNNNEYKNLKLNINSPIYIELQRIINNSPLDENTQLKIEQFLYNQGLIFLRNKNDEVYDINYYKLNPFVLEYLKKSKEELSILIDNYRSNVNIIRDKDIKNSQESVEYLLLNNLKNEIIISRLLGRLLRIISNHNLLNKNTYSTDLASDLANSLLYDYYSVKYSEFIKNKDSKDIGLSEFIKDNNLEKSNSNINNILIVFGFKLLNFLVEVDLIYSEVIIIEKNKSVNIYVAKDKILELMGNSFGLLSLSHKIPMIVPPKPYVRDKSRTILGGYLLNDKQYVNPIIIKNHELREQATIKNENIIFDTVNNLSSVGYKINIPVLEFILEKGVEYNLIIDPCFQHDLEIKKNNKEKLSVYEKKTLDSFLSKKQLEMNILALATIFKNVPEFFIPVRIDNRGRIYCMADYLNYQGIELAKSLLLFSKGDKVSKCDNESINFLKIFGGNCYGNGIEKKSFQNRIDWVNDNLSDILNFRNGKLIKEADSKLLFIAFCFEFGNYFNSLKSNDTSYITYFPIQLDATCNGYQHLSLLMGDESLAGHLNLISEDPESIPQDFYSFIGLKINDYLNLRLSDEKNKKEKYICVNKDLDNKEILNIEKNIQSCERLLKLNKNRSLVKIPIMVKPYNASLFRMIEYIKESFKKVTEHFNNENGLFNSIQKSLNSEDKIFYVSDNNIILTNLDFFIFITTLEKAIYTEFPKLKELNEYLNKIASICVYLNISITWALPSGLIVKQYYEDSEAIRLKPFKYRKNTFTIKVRKKNVVNKSKQIRSLMPNLIHSLDAASLSLIVNMFYIENIKNSKLFNFFAIHDCFAVTANNISFLIKIIKLVYIKIYTDDNYLRRFDQGIIESIKAQFGDDSFDDINKTIKINEEVIDYPDVNKVIVGTIKASQINKSRYIII